MIFHFISQKDFVRNRYISFGVFWLTFHNMIKRLCEIFLGINFVIRTVTKIDLIAL